LNNNGNYLKGDIGPVSINWVGLAKLPFTILKAMIFQGDFTDEVYFLAS